MALSVFDLFKIGIGPSSSHTVGPMKAAARFLDALGPRLAGVGRIKVGLYGSLGATGVGHASDAAVVLGLLGEDPRTVDTRTAGQRVAEVRAREELLVAGTHPLRFMKADLKLYKRRALPGHPNGLVFTAFDAQGAVLEERTYYSIGGGFVIEAGAPETAADARPVPHPFASADELVALTTETGKSIARLTWENEVALRPEEDVRAGLEEIWRVMNASIEAGMATEGLLPGGLRVPRRAPRLYSQLQVGTREADPLAALDWVTLYAMAVSEENAAGGRVVTAPTNGAAGVIPAVLRYYRDWIPGANDVGVTRFLLTAGAIGQLLKSNASISGAEVGCQGEVGSACSMAAAALCGLLGGSPRQVENAAEIALEHNLGLTCDPVAGLVQIPCIERNAIAAVKSLAAARTALHGDGTHLVTFDAVMRTMLDTGRDMMLKYKETARGGLAVNVVNC